MGAWRQAPREQRIRPRRRAASRTCRAAVRGAAAPRHTRQRGATASTFSAQRRLGGGQARDRQTVRRAGHVVEPAALAELDRAGIAAVLTADADLERAPLAAAALDGDADQRADPVLVDRLERIARIDLELVDVRLEKTGGSRKGYDAARIAFANARLTTSSGSRGENGRPVGSRGNTS